MHMYVNVKIKRVISWPAAKKIIMSLGRTIPPPKITRVGCSFTTPIRSHGRWNQNNQIIM